MSTRREFLAEAASIAAIGGLGFLPGLNDKEKPACPEIDDPNVRVSRTGKTFEFPDFQVIVGLWQITFNEKPGHRFYNAKVISLCGEVDDHVFIDLDDGAVLHSLGWLEEGGKRTAVKTDPEEQLQRRLALTHIDQLKELWLPEEKWEDLGPYTCAKMYSFLDTLEETIWNLSEPDCIREEPWTC